ncbi:MAG TPA: HAD-IA family hydrolase [Syntrophorhabdales bacterium]|nr:HAD-IA family hydrolase [Syntrophorhabdales bacterium]
MIYDCDGVLFDSLEANRRLYNHISASMGRGPLTESELKYCHTHTVFEAIHSLFIGDAATEKRALDFLKHQVDLKQFVEYLIMEPYILEALTALRKRNILTAISTNRTTSMKHVIERFKLGSYFDMVVTALDVEHPKPHGESVEKILAAFNLKKNEALFVGDSDVDKQTAEASGVCFVAYKARHLSADTFIDDHLALLDVLSGEDAPQE